MSDKMDPLVTPVAALCLCFVDEAKTGREMVRLVGARLGHAVPAASVYSALRRMRAQNLIVERKERARPDGRLRYWQTSHQGVAVRDHTLSVFRKVVSNAPDG